MLGCAPLALAQREYVITTGLAGLKSRLGCSNCSLILEGNFAINEVLSLDNDSNVTIRGRGATLQVDQSFRFRILNSKNIRYENIDIVDITPNLNPIEATIFDFRNSTNSGLDNIRYRASFAKRRFAHIRNKSSRCFVKNCDIAKADIGVELGSGDMEVSGAPTKECLVENNRIYDFQSSGVRTLTFNQQYSLTTPDSRARHRIAGNMLLNPNINNLAARSAMDINGSEIILEGNTVFGNTAFPPQSGINLRRAHGTICRGNRVSGRFQRAGIRLETASRTLVSENFIEKVDDEDYYVSAILITKFSGTDSISTDNTISTNQILNCKKGFFLEGGWSDNSLISGNIINGATIGLFSTGARFELRQNRFVNTVRGIYTSGGGLSDSPNQIAGNSFSNTSSYILFNENNAGAGRPFIFEGNQVYIWGDIAFPEAIVLRCGASRISGNSFISDGRSTAGFPIPLAAAAKSFGYGVINGHVFKDNHLGPGVEATPNGGSGDKVGIVNNAGCCGTGTVTDD